MRIPFDYLDYWDIDDLAQFIECYGSVDKQAKGSTQKGRTYTEDDLDELP